MNHIYEFLCSVHKNGRSGFTDEGFNHYMTILEIIHNKMFNPEQPESKFVELVVSENWDYAYQIADTRNKEAINFCDLFRKFVEHTKKNPEYILLHRESQINSIVNG